ncbi:hypothetical protein [Parabacteroides sp. PF5-6]|uniref:hypothetical protein n=1 Tax=Parabacteroides sp. PF5-6 TaxID=1742403 RepID=UPI0024068E14|nr:hypothetical protein [Parabacteroides sp. PF5-6]MDF9829552.1 hypothetical protein [Parabacteroides sp. PF5-6]
MKRYVREIFTALFLILALIAGILYFYQRIQAGKRTELINLHTLIASQPEMIIRLNRPQVVASLILTHKDVKSLFHSVVPGVFLSLIEQSPSSSTPLLSVHPQGILFYTKAEDKDVKRFEKEVFKRHFPAYHPTVEKKDDITYAFYPDTANRFFGYYHHEGVLVAGYNLKLLEEVAVRQQDILRDSTLSLQMERYSSDKQAPMNLFFPVSTFDLHFALNDSVTWHAGKEWFATDIFSSEGKICCYARLEMPQALDSLHLSLAADTLSRQIERLLPDLEMESQWFQEDNLLNYTGCTSNPS